MLSCVRASLLTEDDVDGEGRFLLAARVSGYVQSAIHDGCCREVFHKVVPLHPRMLGAQKCGPALCLLSKVVKSVHKLSTENIYLLGSGHPHKHLLQSLDPPLYPVTVSRLSNHQYTRLTVKPGYHLLD